MIDEKTRVQEWLTNFVSSFRSEVKQLSDLEKRFISNNDDYRKPCQLDVFWMTNPEFQLLMITHSNKRHDLDIHVHGPYQADVFVQKIETILQEPRWNEIPTPRDKRSRVMFPNLEKLSYGELAASQLNAFIRNTKNAIFRQIERPSRNGGTIFADYGWVWTFYGNMSDLDYKQITRARFL